MAYETAVLKQLEAYTAKHLSRMGGFSPHIRLTDYILPKDPKFAIIMQPQGLISTSAKILHFLLSFVPRFSSIPFNPLKVPKGPFFARLLDPWYEGYGINADKVYLNMKNRKNPSLVNTSTQLIDYLHSIA